MLSPWAVLRCLCHFLNTEVENSQKQQFKVISLCLLFLCAESSFKLEKWCDSDGQKGQVNTAGELAPEALLSGKLADCGAQAIVFSCPNCGISDWTIEGPGTKSAEGSDMFLCLDDFLEMPPFFTAGWVFCMCLVIFFSFDEEKSHWEQENCVGTVMALLGGFPFNWSR